MEETKLKKLIAESRELAKTLDKFADELEKKKAPSVTPQPEKHTEERTKTHECDLEHIIKSTIKEYLDKECDDVTELLLSLNKDLCERIRKEK